MSEEPHIVKDVLYIFGNKDSFKLSELPDLARKQASGRWDLSYIDFSIDCNLKQDYGECCAQYVTALYGHRLENDAEKKHRLKEEVKKAKEEEILAKQREKWERKQLKELTKKYGKIS